MPSVSQQLMIISETPVVNDALGCTLLLLDYAFKS